MVERLLAKDSTRRYDSTRDAARDLHNIHDAFASTIAAEEIPRPPLVKRRTLMAFALIAAILLVGGAAILVLYKRTVPGQEAPAPAKKYIAVTQFIDRTGDPNGQLVVDGLSETLAARLARFNSVQVMRPTSPDTVKPTDTPQEIARNLGANVLLTGYATDICYAHTCAGYENLARDFNVFLVGDATLSSFPGSLTPRFNTSAHLSSASLDHLITQISWIRSLNPLPSFAISDGLVVIPSTRPSSAALRISSMLAVSRNSRM